MAIASSFATAAHAHGFGQRYDLPLPLSLYLVGTAAAVAVSFVIVGLLVQQAPRSDAYPRIDLSRSIGRLIARPEIVLALRLSALALFVLTVAAGFWGDPNPYRNIAPTMVWIIVWVGLAYVSAFVGNIWALINPWRTAFDAADWLCRRVAGAELSLRRPYPEALGVWPAVALLVAFSWIELVYPSPAVPSHIAWLAVGYSLLTWAGMIVFGETWLDRGEVFSLVFGTFARFAPTEVSRRGPALRPFGAGLLDSGPVSISMTAFVLLLLSSVLYDGLLGTPEWSIVEGAVSAKFPAFAGSGLMFVRTAGLVTFWLLFLGAYLAVSALMSTVLSRRLSPLAIAQSFAFTLVPIAIGYHLAHYLTFLLVQGQYIVPLASDPFGFGWNLFGTAGYRADIGIVGARFAWYAALTAILLGHIAAVYLAHLKAMRLLPSRAAALRSQIPLTALMVVYTFVSLSILAEPIVERRAPAQPSAVKAEIDVPADAVLPEAGSGGLQPVGEGRTARQKLTYRVLGSAFHDGTRMTGADILYAIMFAYRWSDRRNRDRYDPIVEAATASMRKNLVGLKLVGTDTTSKSFRIADVEFVRELFAIDVYLAASPIDPDQDAALAPPWSTLPWHVIALMEEAVDRGWAAFSQAEAARRGVEWLDVVRSDDLKKRLAGLIESFARDGYRPDGLRALVSPDDARKRWAALAAFFREHNHFLVANGPYRLKRWSNDSVTLEAFRDLSYPLGVGSYDSYAIPRRGFITKVERKNDEVRLFGDIELVMKHQRDYDIVRRPLPSIARDVLQRAAPECRFMVTDEAGRVVLAGHAPLADDLSFHIDLGGKLPSGRFTLVVQIIVNGNAMNADIRRIPVGSSGS